MRKRAFGHKRTTEAQIRLRGRAVWSGPSLSANRISWHYGMYQWKANPRMLPCACAGWSEYTHSTHVRRHFFDLHGLYFFYPVGQFVYSVGVYFCLKRKGVYKDIYYIFFFLLQNVDCGCSLESPQWGWWVLVRTATASIRLSVIRVWDNGLKQIQRRYISETHDWNGSVGQLTFLNS